MPHTGKVRRRAAPAPSTVAAEDDKRTRILDAAEAIFARRGFDATPTAAIAVDAQVPKGLVFYYFPRKIDILRALLDERLPTAPLGAAADVVLPDDPAASLLRLAQHLGIGEHESAVLRTIIFREVGTHPEVREHVRRLREGLLDLTESVLDASCATAIEPTLRRQAAQTFVAVMLDEANARWFDGPLPDVAGAAHIVSQALAPGSGC